MRKIRWKNAEVDEDAEVHSENAEVQGINAEVNNINAEVHTKIAEVQNYNWKMLNSCVERRFRAF